MNNIGLINREDTALLVIDVQERLMPVIHNNQQVFEQVNRLIRGAQILRVSTIVTEQYPKGLGHTCAEVQVPDDASVIQKISFSCLLSEPVKFKLQEQSIHSLILCGVESHICVLKTALEALKLGYQVHVVADAVSSRTESSKKLALDRMRQSGAFIVNTEMILFQLMQEAGTEEFKAISQLIK
jgi:nicotinamidase-related amidase